MKRLVKTLMVGILLGAVLLSGCKSKEEDTSNKDVSNQTRESMPNSDTPITIVTHYLSCKEDGKELSTGKYSEIVFSDEYKKEYPALWEEVEDLNESWNSATNTAVSEYAGYKSEEENPQDSAYVSEVEASILRADDKLFPVSVYNYDDAGGAHPSHYTSIINFDAQTGDHPSLENVLTDEEGFPKQVRSKMEEAYPECMEVVDDYFYPEETVEEADVFQYKLDEDSYMWAITKKGLEISFPPYDIAPYAYGEMGIEFLFDEYPDIVKEAFFVNEKTDVSSQVKTEEDDEVAEVEATEFNYESEQTVISNPTWERYMDEDQTEANGYVTLTEISKEKTDWLNTSVWADENGFTLAEPTYEDENYSYIPTLSDSAPYDYQYTGIMIYDKESDTLLYDIDLYALCNGPDESMSKESDAFQYLRYAKVVDDILYVEIGHNGYASEEPQSNYICAIDLLNDDRLLFRSEPLTANASNFLIVDDTIICGYGFTDEKDALYLLDRFTGDRVQTIPLESMAEQFEIRDDTLYVACYNTAYKYKVSR